MDENELSETDVIKSQTVSDEGLAFLCLSEGDYQGVSMIVFCRQHVEQGAFAKVIPLFVEHTTHPIRFTCQAIVIIGAQERGVTYLNLIVNLILQI